MHHDATDKVMPGLKETVFSVGTAILIIGIIISSYGLAVYALAWSHVPDQEQSSEPEDAIYGRSLQSLGVGVFLIGTIVAWFTKRRRSSISRIPILVVAAALPYEMVSYFVVRTPGIPLLVIFVITAMWASILLLYVALTRTRETT